MIKKTKVIFVLLILIGIILCPLKKVNAHSVELDPESVISLPWFITGGSGTITIKDSITNYSLYYQAIEIENTTYSQMEKINSEGETILDTLKEEYTKLKTEVDNLNEIYKSAFEAYQNGREGEQSETLKTAYEKAKTDFDNKVNEYSAKTKEYEAKAKEINDNIKKLIPTYIEDKWVQTTDNKISVDLTKFSGEQAFAIWVKLVTNDNKTYYDVGTYSMTGTKEAEVSVESVGLDNTSLSIEEGNSYTLSATINPSNATDKSVVWTSDNENVAKVENGKVTAVSEGTATITETTNDGKHTASCKVTVTKKTTAQKPKDTTASETKLPYTGYTTTYIIAFMIVILTIIGIICYKKIKFYNFK